MTMASALHTRCQECGHLSLVALPPRTLQRLLWVPRTAAGVQALLAISDEQARRPAVGSICASKLPWRIAGKGWNPHDSSFGARKELAKELNYTGDTNDSAAMNIWLHREVMSIVQLRKAERRRCYRVRCSRIIT